MLHLVRGNGGGMDILVTNNPLVQQQYRSDFRVTFLDTDLPGIFIYVRDLIHKGHILLTHPLSGSIKPNESPYKSVIVTELATGGSIETDLQSVSIIEECIETAKKFPPENIGEKHLPDMQMLDLSLIKASQINK